MNPPSRTLRTLAALRADIELSRSPLPDRPGILIRDPCRYAETCLVIPPILASGLTLFDGDHTDGDLRALLSGALGTPSPTAAAAEVAAQLEHALSDSGFLADATFAEKRAHTERAFCASPIRFPAHAGTAYPSDAAELAAAMATWAPPSSSPAPPPTPDLIGIAAPHASPEADPASYAAAYAALTPDHGRRTFVVLGTSHRGAPNRLSLTRKPFQTPLGVARTDVSMVDALIASAPDAFAVEDYCHAIEHSIEFQVLFLQNRFGPDIRILPILCGPFRVDAPSPIDPAHGDPALARSFAALADLHAGHAPAICWVLGVDMAHVGRRYGDRGGAQAGDTTMQMVAGLDRARIDAIAEGDAAQFWRRLHAHGDDPLKWCGSAPIYTLLRVVPGLRARLLRYHQWNIDEASVVSFASLSFHRVA